MPLRRSRTYARASTSFPGYGPTVSVHPDDAEGVNGQTVTRIDDGRSWTYTRSGGVWSITSVPKDGYRSTIGGETAYRFGLHQYVPIGEQTGDPWDAPVNEDGNLMNNNGQSVGYTNTNEGSANCMAIRVLGDTHARMNGVNGTANFAAIAHPTRSGSKIWQFRTIRGDYNETPTPGDGQSGTQGYPVQRCMWRQGIGGGTPTWSGNGLGTVWSVGDTVLLCRVHRYPAAFWAMNYWDDPLIDQIKQNASDPPWAISKYRGDVTKAGVGGEGILLNDGGSSSFGLVLRIIDTVADPTAMRYVRIMSDSMAGGSMADKDIGIISQIKVGVAGTAINRVWTNVDGGDWTLRTDNTWGNRASTTNPVEWNFGIYCTKTGPGSSAVPSTIWSPGDLNHKVFIGDPTALNWADTSPTDDELDDMFQYMRERH